MDLDRDAFHRMPDRSDPYLVETERWVNTFGEGLWDDLGRVPLLGESSAKAILRGLLERACQCQNMSNIQAGRYGLVSLPRGWVRANIEGQAEPLLGAQDAWEWRRLLEVYWSLDAGLLGGLVSRALASADGEIREAGRDFLVSGADAGAA